METLELATEILKSFEGKDKQKLHNALGVVGRIVACSLDEGDGPFMFSQKTSDLKAA